MVVIHDDIPIWELFACRAFLGDYLEEGDERKGDRYLLPTWVTVPKKQMDR